MLKQIDSHSLFSEARIDRQKNRTFLLQCILMELFTAFSQEAHSLFSLQELVKALPTAFPNKTSKLKQIISTLFVINHSSSSYPSDISKLFFLLEPFMKECKNDESFLFFLLTHQTEVIMVSSEKYFITLLSKLYPKGLASLQQHLCDYFHKKGFTYLLPTVRSLVNQVKNT
jgi:hypothetical protein